MPLFILKYSTWSEWYIFFSLFNQLVLLWNTTWKFSSASDSHEESLNRENIFVIKKCGYINPFHGQLPVPVLSLEHLTLVIHTGLLQSIHGFFQLSSCSCNPNGVGAPTSCILSEWNLDRPFPPGAKQNKVKPPTSSGPSFGYDCESCHLEE